MPEKRPTENLKHYATITGLFVAVLLISNIASVKILTLWEFTLDGGTILFPLTYIFGDILTEVYGFRRARKVIWTGFVAALLMSVVFLIVGILPAAAGWENQSAYDAILGFVPRIVAASLLAYLAGELSNSIILAKMKIASRGKELWKRTIGSTIVGEAVDTTIFVIVAFAGVLPFDVLLAIAVSNYVFKTGVEVLFTPMTYKIVEFLKKSEKEDYYDYNTKFTPF